jgi:hypothetical protein
MTTGYKLKSIVSANSAVNSDDVWVLKQALRQEGYYSEPVNEITPFPDRELFKAIKRFQSDTGLRVDGVVKPGGETERKIQEQLKAVAKFRCIICNAWHGGLYSPHICWQCWEKAAT